MSKQKPTLSFWQIWNMSFGFLGIQFGFALQNANVSRIFETLGAKVEDIPILWVAAPLTGLIVQPIIGHMSDKTWGRWGRRRPYFMVGAILASIAIVFMPLSPVLWIAAGTLWIMDASINISMEPFRAFVGDMLPEKQRNTGFAMQTFFIGVGAVVASALPYILSKFNVAETAPEGQIPDTVRWSFFIGGAVFLLCVLYTVFTTKEYSPEEMAEFESEQDQASESETRNLDFEGLRRAGMIWSVVGVAMIAFFWYLIQIGKGKQELYVLGGMILAYGLALFYTSTRDGKKVDGLTSIMTDLKHMPLTMRQLAVVQFFSWFALFSMWIYTSNTVSRHYYETQVEATTLSQLQSALPQIQDEAKRADLEAELSVLVEEAKAEGSAFVPPAVYKPFLGGVLVDDAELLNRLPEEVPESIAEDVGRARASDNKQLSAATLAFILDKDLFDTGLRPQLEAHADLRRVQEEYNSGGDWVGVCFSIYNGVAAIFAILLPLVARRMGRRKTHMFCLTAGGLGLAAMFFGNHPNVLLGAMVGIGIAWAGILSMPYAMLTSTLPQNKLGVYMGIFNFFIVIPQLVAASLLGFLVGGLFGGDPVFAMLIGGASMIIGGILSLRIGPEAEA